jgi:ubiquinone/menaquinone biosynthesis C-methylase UbiE
MDDDRGPDRRSSPDVLAMTRKRKASRGLRVPNDPVPRASQPDVARVSIADHREIDEFGDRVTQVAPPSLESDALIERANEHAAHAPASPAGESPEAPPPVLVVAVDLAAARENEHSETIEDRTQLDATIGSDDVESLTAMKKPSAPRVINVQDETGTVVRQVRRRIRSIGSDEPHVSASASSADGPDLSTTEEVFVAPSAVASLAARDEAKGVEGPSIAEAPGDVESIETVNVSIEDEAVQVDSSDVEDEAALAARATTDAAPSPPAVSPSTAEKTDAVRQVEPPSDDDAGAEVEIETAADVEVEAEADADGDAEDEVSSVEVEEPTEEISIPAALDASESKPTPPPRSSMPDTAKRPPPPRTASEPARPAERPTTVSADAKPRRRHWWEEIFNDDYLRTQRRYTAEQTKTEGNFIEASLGVEKGAAVLDVGCGTGRQAVELASRGYEVLGLDLSLPMLSRASDSAQLRGVKLNFLQSDMLEMEFKELFDAAYCVGSTFGFFDDDKNADVIHRIHQALKPGGTMLLEVVNRDYGAPQHPAMTWYEADGCVCMEETQFNWFTSRLEGKRTLLLEDGRQKEQKFSMRLYSLHELGKILHTAGFRVIEVSGHQKTAGAFFGANSAMLIILAQKRADDE